MSLSFLNHLERVHRNFLNDIKSTSQFDTTNPISILPTVIFLLGTFFFLNRIIHRRTFQSTPRHIWIYREIGFQWTYFYALRIWFLTIKLLRLVTNILQAKIKESPERYNLVTPISVQLMAYTFLTSISLLPSIMLVYHYAGRRHIPNFLMWVGEDPWLHSEIGIAGHYLDRPPNFSLPVRNDCAYRVHRSISYENVTKKLNIIRNSRSDEAIKCVKRIEELLN